VKTTAAKPISRMTALRFPRHPRSDRVWR